MVFRTPNSLTPEDQALLKTVVRRVMEEIALPEDRDTERELLLFALRYYERGLVDPDQLVAYCRIGITRRPASGAGSEKDPEGGEED